MDRQLIWELAKRQLLQRTQGSVLGIIWNLLTPLVLLILYSLVFGIVFDSQWTGALADVPYALVMYSGLVLHTLWAETTSSSAYCVQSWVPLVKRTSVDLLDIPVANFVANYVVFLLNCVPLMALYMIVAPNRTPLAVLFPLIGVVVQIAAAAAGFFIASVSVYFKDIQNLLPLLNAAILFLNPIFFPLEALPSGIGEVMEWLSPIATPIELGRVILFGGDPPFGPSSLTFALLWPLLMVGSLRVYRHLSRGFADVL